MNGRPPPTSSPPRTILVVDDDETFRLLVRDSLEAEDYHILEAAGGEDALRILRKEQADLVLLDVAMPGRNGFSVCEEIRSDPALADISVVMMTSTNQIDAVRQAFAVQADNFIAKPVDWELLPYLLRFTLRRRDDAIALRDALARSRAADEARAQFLAAMGHELRTPLNAIIGFSEVIATNALGATDMARYAKYGEHILNGGRRLLAMINAILDLVDIQDKNMVLSLSSLNVASVLESMRGKLEGLCFAAGHAFVMHCESGLPEVLVDRVRIGQIVENLVSNAVKFTPAGGKVEIAVLNSKGGVDIRIADSGIGMSREGIEIAMQAFRQLDASLSRKHEGAGLGLSIAKALTELHEGTLSIESEVGHGTVVTVHLPVRSPPKLAV